MAQDWEKDGRELWESVYRENGDEVFRLSAGPLQFIVGLVYGDHAAAVWKGFAAARNAAAKAFIDARRAEGVEFAFIRNRNCDCENCSLRGECPEASS